MAGFDKKDLVGGFPTDQDFVDQGQTAGNFLVGPAIGIGHLPGVFFVCGFASCAGVYIDGPLIILLPRVEEGNRSLCRLIAVLAGNTGFGKAGKDQLLKIAPTMGIEVVETEVYDKQSKDLSAVIAKIKANQDVQAVVNWSIVPAQAIVAKNMRQAGWEVPLFQSHGFGNIKYVEAAGAAAEGIIFPAGRLLVADKLPDGHPQKALLLDYIAAYEEKYKEAASTFGGHAYDAYIIAKAAIETAGTDKAKIRDAIEQKIGRASCRERV
mgnify:CR=1 FL=1